MDGIAFYNKWLHLLSIIGVLGGLAFAWIVLARAAGRDEEPPPVLAAAWKRFGISLGILWLVVLATGFINLALVSPKVNSGYQQILGIKMGLAILMFILSMLIAHPLPAMARFFRNRSAWLAILVVLGILVVGLSAHLNLSRIDRSGLKASSPDAAASEAVSPGPAR